jgi:hypothetical protein
VNPTVIDSRQQEQWRAETAIRPWRILLATSAEAPENEALRRVAAADYARRRTSLWLAASLGDLVFLSAFGDRSFFFDAIIVLLSI